jgi:hypothetical protein
VPSEPAESGFAKRIKLKSYALIEQGGVLWTYMGRTERTPPLPQWEFSLVSAGQRFVSKRLQECNDGRRPDVGLLLHQSRFPLRRPSFQHRQDSPHRHNDHLASHGPLERDGRSTDVAEPGATGQ